MQHQNPVWHTMTVDQVEKHFKTDRNKGLSPKICRTRLERFGKNELFVPEAISVKHCVKRILSDTSLLVLAFICLVALCFARFQAALTVLFVLAISCTVSIIAYIKTNRVKETMSAHSAPQVRVLRGGQELFCEATGVVPGDVLLLAKGDVIPCDARLVVADSDFSVLTCMPDEKGQLTYVLIPKDAAAVYAADETVSAFSCTNMVYAGSIVQKGAAMAIVTETGLAVLLADYMGPHPLAKQVGDPVYLKPMRRYMNRYSIVMCALILPVTIAGIFAGKGNLDVFDVLLLILSLVVSSMSEQALSMGRIICACSIIRSSYGSDRKDAAIIKNYKALDTLCRVDELFLYGKEALSDGHMHPYAVYTAEGLSIGYKMKNGAVAQLYETVYRYERCIAEHGVTNEDSTIDAAGWSCAVKELGDILAFDCARADIRTISLTPVPVAPEWVEVTMQRLSDQTERRFRIHRCTQPEPLLRCNASNKVGKTVSLNNDERQALFDVFTHLKNQGMDVCAYVREERGYVIFEGILACREAFDPALREVRRHLEESHVRVSLFLSEEGPSQINYLMSAGWIETEKEAVCASEVRENGKTLADVFGKKRVFLGFAEAEIAEQAALCRENGKRTAGLGLCYAEDSLAFPVDVTFCCEPRKEAPDASDEPAVEPAPLTSSDEYSQTIRREADVLIHRAGPEGGGLSGVAGAIFTARSISFRMMLTLQYLLVAQMLRLTLVIVPLVFGWLTISPALLLISGVWVDLAYILICAVHHCSHEVLRDVPDHDRFFKSPLRSRPDWVVATIICGLFTVLSAWILKGIGLAPQNNGLSLYIFLSLLSAQTCLLLCLLRTAGSFTKRLRSHVSAVLILLVLVAMLAFVILIPPIAKWFGASGMSALLVLIALFSPLYLLGSYFLSLSYRPKLMRSVLRIFKKESGTSN